MCSPSFLLYLSLSLEYLLKRRVCSPKPTYTSNLRRFETPTFDSAEPGDLRRLFALCMVTNIVGVPVAAAKPGQWEIPAIQWGDKHGPKLCWGLKESHAKPRRLPGAPSVYDGIWVPRRLPMISSRFSCRASSSSTWICGP